MGTFILTRSPLQRPYFQIRLHSELMGVRISTQSFLGTQFNPQKVAGHLPLESQACGLRGHLLWVEETAGSRVPNLPQLSPGPDLPVPRPCSPARGRQGLGAVSMRPHFLLPSIRRGTTPTTPVGGPPAWPVARGQLAEQGDGALDSSWCFDQHVLGSGGSHWKASSRSAHRRPVSSGAAPRAEESGAWQRLSGGGARLRGH